MVNLQPRTISGHNHSYDTESEHLNFLKISVGSEYTYNVQKPNLRDEDKKEDANSNSVFS